MCLQPPQPEQQHHPSLSPLHPQLLAAALHAWLHAAARSAVATWTSWPVQPMQLGAHQMTARPAAAAAAAQSCCLSSCLAV